MSWEIQNTDFLECFNYINRVEDMQLYRYLEDIVLNVKTASKSDIDLLQTLGHSRFVEEKRKKYHKIDEFSKSSRKNIKDNMLENYVIRNNKDKKFLQELSFKIFLKNILPRNIIVEEGEIVEIIF